MCVCAHTRELATCSEGFVVSEQRWPDAVRVELMDNPQPGNVYDKLMTAQQFTCPPNDPWKTVVLYEAHLEHADESEPLWRVPYFGQIVRSGTANEIFATRKGEHERDTVNEEKVLGLHAVINIFGPDALEWNIVSSESGPRSTMSILANSEEIRLISKHGGPLRDMCTRLTQTLNLTNGGSGANFVCLDAFRLSRFSIFQAAMEVYVRENESSLVPFSYITDEHYQLGHVLLGFRQGKLRIGMQRETEITAWAEALPCWQWNAVKAAANIPERIVSNSTTTKNWWKNASDNDRSKRVSQMTEGQNCPERLEANAENARQWWKTASVTTKEKRAERQLVSLKRQREENPDKELVRLAKVTDATRKGYEARLESLTPQEREKKKTKHAADLRGHRKRQADLQLLRSVMPGAKKKDIARAKREGLIP